MKALLTGDWHGDTVTAGFDRWDDVTRAAKLAVEAACDERVDWWIFLGDLCDPDRGRAHEACAHAIHCDAQLDRAGIRRAWLTGNHDVYEDGRGGSTLDPLAAYLVEKWNPASQHAGPCGGFVASTATSVHAAEGIDLVCLPYVARARAYDAAEFVTRLGPMPTMRKILVVGHLMLADAVKGSESAEMARGRDLDWPIDTILATWGDRALMFGGHYHRRHVARGVRFVGSLERLRFDEEDNRPGWTIVEVES